MQSRFRIFVYHHTHWDREWWAPMQHLRVRLVALIDELLDVLDQDPDFRSFLLDGQTIILNDYLEIRPENKERLAGYLKANRIQCGPWYVLPDEFLVSGEAHIRNLWLGERTAADLGYSNLDAGYLPDTFGHISQMPQILRGFGIDSAFLWRGLGGDPATLKQEFLWAAADGTRVLTHWFADGYYVFDIPQKPYEVTYAKVRKLLDRWAQRATTDCLLLPYGGDHLFVDRKLSSLLQQLNHDIQDVGELRWSTTKEYVEAIRRCNPRLETRQGELRAFGADHPHLLPGVLSTRLYLKQMNFHGQTWLERYAEPFSTLAWRHGRTYDQSLLWRAWEWLVQNHAHDSIGGCSIDQVHKEMIVRFDQSRQIAEVVTEQSIQYINSQIDTTDLAPGEQAVVVHNPLPWARTGLVRVWIERKAGVHPRTHVLHDGAGAEIPFQVNDVDGLRPLTDKWQYAEVQFVASAVPGLGYRTYRLGSRETPRDPKQLFLASTRATARLKGSEEVTDLRIGDYVLENQFYRVEVNPRDGSLSVTDKASGATYHGLNVFEDGGDAGDEYAYSAPLNDMVVRSDDGARVHVTIAEAGYAVATLRVDLDWALPGALSPDRLSRDSGYEPCRISTFVSLASASRHIDIRTEWQNRSRDHRLRALFPLGAAVHVSHAEGHFDVVERPVEMGDPGNGWPEPAVPTLPQQGYASVHSGSRGLTILNKGLPEFEVLQDGRGTIAVTLLRAVGWLSREDTLARTGGAGAEIPVPDAQSPGPNRVEYAIVPHAGSWLEANSYRTAHEYLAPMYGSVTDRHPGELPHMAGFLALEGEHTLLLSAVKKAERAEAMILRFWNVAGHTTEATIRLQERPRAVRLVNLKEEPLEDIPVATDGSFVVHAGPAKIVTVELRFVSG